MQHSLCTASGIPYLGLPVLLMTKIQSFAERHEYKIEKLEKDLKDIFALISEMERLNLKMPSDIKEMILAITPTLSLCLRLALSVRLKFTLQIPNGEPVLALTLLPLPLNPDLDNRELAKSDADPTGDPPTLPGIDIELLTNRGRPPNPEELLAPSPSMYIVVLTVLVLAPMGAAPIPPLNSCLRVVVVDEEAEEELGETNLGIGIRKFRPDRSVLPNEGECLSRGLVITLPKVEFGEAGGCGGWSGACDDTSDEEEALATGFLSHEVHEDDEEIFVVEAALGYRGVGDNKPDSDWDFGSCDADWD
ncbi:hypothetical protein EST38_g8938 [Candolleomyces aberdarensis]|uniref:Uncharacterized protein n=1 Tax=Candolleomyces aberdarensis TaxID=2316362 RepID=A0A4Q2DB76_9AGAR|nr:hypothetical protein EST38_g8938 [Candolleomyces aberdarensis]